MQLTLKQLKEVSNNAAAAKTVVKAGKNINVTDSEDPLTKAKDLYRLVYKTQ